MSPPQPHIARGAALACVAALGAMTLHAARTPVGAAHHSAAARPTVVGAYWPVVVVTGVVRGAPRGTAVPLANAQIAVHSGAGTCGLRAVSGRGGGFAQRCRNVSRAGAIELHLGAEGHIARTVTGRARPPEAGDPSVGVFEVDVALTPWRPTPGPSPIAVDGRSNVELAATVVDGSRPGAPPVSDVRVVAAYDDAEWAYSCLSPVVTDAAGRFAMLCPQANHLVPIRLRFRAEGFAPAEGTWFMGFPSRGGPTRVVLQPAATPPPGAPATPTDVADRLPRLDVSGIVRGADGTAMAPVARADVVVAGRPGHCAAATTAADGSFALRCTDLDWNGALDVDVTPPDGRHRPWSATVDLGQPGAWGDALHLDVVLAVAAATPTPTATSAETATATATAAIATATASSLRTATSTPRPRALIPFARR